MSTRRAWTSSCRRTFSLWEGDDDIFYSILGQFGPGSRAVTSCTSRGLSVNGLLGLSPIRHHARLLELANNSVEFARSFYRNGCRTTGVFKNPKALRRRSPGRGSTSSSPTPILGAQNAGKPAACLKDGLDYSSIHDSRPRNAQFIATRLQSIDEIATIFGVSAPHGRRLEPLDLLEQRAAETSSSTT